MRRASVLALQGLPRSYCSQCRKLSRSEVPTWASFVSAPRKPEMIFRSLSKALIVFSLKPLRSMYSSKPAIASVTLLSVRSEGVLRTSGAACGSAAAPLRAAGGADSSSAGAAAGGVVVGASDMVRLLEGA